MSLILCLQAGGNDSGRAVTVAVTRSSQTRGSLLTFYSTLIPVHLIPSEPETADQQQRNIILSDECKNNFVHI